MELHYGCMLSWMVIVNLCSYVISDIPVDCTYEEIKGDWVFKLGKEGQGRHIDCTEHIGERYRSHYSHVNIMYAFSDILTIVYNCIVHT